MDLLHPSIEDLLCDESFQRYCRGEDIADVLPWETWIKTHPDQQPTVVAAKRLFETLSLGQGNRLEQSAALKDAIDRHGRLRAQIGENERVVWLPQRRKWLGYAAGLAALIGLGLLVVRFYLHADKKQRVYEYATGPHDHKTVVLPDSSIVLLNENSHLTLQKDFGISDRRVAIEGEAFFDIRRDVSHPFLVATKAYAIRVLGTSFNVRAYPGNPLTETSLISGKIEIVSAGRQDKKDSVVLRPNQKYILDLHPSIVRNAGKVLSLSPDTLTHRLAETSWARRKMEVNNETFDQIAWKLQSWYGIKIKFADAEVRNYRYTASFDDETIFKALQYLQQSYPFSFRIEDGCIVIAKS